MVGQEPKLHLIVIYIWCLSEIDFLWWNIESISELDSEGANTPMSLGDPYFELMSYDDMVYEGWIDSSFTLVHKDELVITQSCIGDSK